MPRGTVVASVLPFVPALAGLALSIGRFRAHEPLAGLAFALGGLLLMVVVVFLAGSGEAPGDLPGGSTG